MGDRTDTETASGTGWAAFRCGTGAVVTLIRRVFPRAFATRTHAGEGKTAWWHGTRLGFGGDENGSNTDGYH
jgi:hypothetical protein